MTCLESVGLNLPTFDTCKFPYYLGTRAAWRPGLLGGPSMDPQNPSAQPVAAVATVAAVAATEGVDAAPVAVVTVGAAQSVPAGA
jgi:hypothetical protein